MLKPALIVGIVFGFLSAAALAEARRATQEVGAQEGGARWAECPPFRNLVGLEVYSRDDIDAVRPVCAEAVVSGTEIRIVDPAPVGAAIGGRADGANLSVLRCPPEAPIVTGAEIGVEADATAAVNSIRLECAGAGPNAARATGGSFAAPPFERRGDIGAHFHTVYSGAASCTKSFGGYVGAGVFVYTRGDWVHALGFSCDDLKTTARAVGRTRAAPPALGVGARAGVTPRVGETMRCERYAASAVASALEARNLGCGFTGGRWSTDMGAHQTWCASVKGDPGALEPEEAGRADQLNVCRQAKEK